LIGGKLDEPIALLGASRANWLVLLHSFYVNSNIAACARGDTVASNPLQKG
jgi:hypothetical protein